MTLILDPRLALVARARIDSLALPHLLSCDYLTVVRVRVHRVVILDPGEVAQVMKVFAFLLEKRLELGSLELFVPLSLILHEFIEVQLVRDVELVLRPTERNTVDSMSLSV